jgi:hypothetical protein
MWVLQEVAISVPIGAATSFFFNGARPARLREKSAKNDPLFA